MQNQLENVLKTLDPLPVDHNGQPINSDDGIIGTWQLDNALALTVDVLSEVASQTGQFLTYEAYDKVQMHQDNPEKPNKPAEPDDPIYDPPGIEYDQPLDRRVAKKIRYTRTHNAYLASLQTYQTQTANADQIRRSFGRGRRHYLGYVDAQISKMEGAQQAGNAESPLETFAKKKRCLPINEATAKLGTFIVGNHGSGKSEVIKHRIWHYLNKPNPSETVVLIDPHGELAYEVARMKPNANSDRLVLIDPFLMPPFVPCPSVLNTPNKSADNLNFEAQHYGAALEMISGGDMSENMTSLCQNCAHVALEDDRFNLYDIMRLLSVEPPRKGKPEKKHPPIYTHACRKSPNFVVREHFNDKFLYGNFGQAKNGLYERMARIIRAPIVQQMMLSTPLFDLPSLIEEKKVIVIRLPMGQLGDDVTRMLGQLFVAQIQLAVLKRDESRLQSYPAVHLFMDEAQHFVSHQTAKQIDELRKFRLHLTLATQYIDKFPAKILESVKGLGIQIAGFCAGKNLTEMNSVFGLKTKDKDHDETTVLNSLSVGNFYFRTRGTKEMPELRTRQFSTDTSLLFNEPKWQRQNADRYMTDAEWAECKANQVAHYYRKIETTDPVETIGDHGETEFKTDRDIEDEFATIKPGNWS